MDQPGILAPGNYDVRDPRNTSQDNGLIFNPPTFPDIGGLSGPGKWKGREAFKVEKPTGTKAGRSAARRI